MFSFIALNIAFPVCFIYIMPSAWTMFRALSTLALIVSLFPGESDMMSARSTHLSINRAEFRFYSFPVSVLLAIPLASPCICTLIGFALATSPRLYRFVPYKYV